MATSLTRILAQRQHAATYQGYICSLGHGRERYTSTGKCVTCSDRASRGWARQLRTHDARAQQQLYEALRPWLPALTPEQILNAIDAAGFIVIKKRR